MNAPSIFVLDKNFIPFYVISEFISFIWTERYWACGDFQLECIYQKELMDVIKVGHYISLGDSSNLMLVERLDISYNPTNAADRIITATGRTLESFLDRRIIWGTWEAKNETVQSFIFRIIRDAIINPKDSMRKISLYRTKTSDDSNISSKRVSISGDGDNIYEIATAVCEANELGMRCEYDESQAIVSFSLYAGVDRSYDQLLRPPVIFSSEYGNLGACRFTFDTKTYKTIAFAVGPWVETDITDDSGNVINTIKTRTEMTVGARSLSGLNRREMFINAGEDDPSEIEYKAMESLAQRNTIEVLDAELDQRRQFKYGQDFFMGDIVQVITDFGLDTKARVIEFIRSWDSSGYAEVPTFKMIEE